MSRVFLFEVLLLFVIIVEAHGKMTKEWGRSKSPPSQAALVGSDYRGGGASYNVYLKLEADGTCSAEWHGCLGKYGESSGKWKLDLDRVTFEPTRQSGTVIGHLTPLDVLQFKDDWILVPTNEKGRILYEDWGVQNLTCYQRIVSSEF